MRSALFLLGGVLLGGLSAREAAGADGWPTFRGDARRSGVSRERLSLPLARAWTCAPAHPPAPAWPEPAPVNYAVMHGPLRQTLGFDRAFHAVSDSASVYFGSSADDTVTCLDAATGDPRWRFTAEGPVRLAPALDGGRLFFGSDDGFLYALEARTGKLLWKYRAGPGDRRLPGNGRTISLWPVRGGLVAEDGTVYFTAGLFPTWGVFLVALDEATGAPVFRQPLDFTAQGVMLASGNRLFVATGRTGYWSCDRRDGRPLIKHGESDPWKLNLVGGSLGLADDDILATGPSEDGQFHWFRFSNKTPLLRLTGECVISRDDRIYILDRGTLSALDREACLAVRKAHKAPPPLWSVGAGRSHTMILAGDALIAGGEGEVGAYSAAEGKALWKDKVEGRVESLAVSGGRLLASLDDGRTVCFGPRGEGGGARAVTEPVSRESGPADPLLARAAEAAVRSAGVTKGYCLVLQPGRGELAREIARRSDFRVVCLEEDSDKAGRLRSVLREAGLYGTRIEVHQGEPGKLPYPRNFASLIVSEASLTEGATLPSADEVGRVLRPFGGVVDIAVRPGSEAHRRLRDWGRGLPGWRVEEGDLVRGTARRGRPPGAGEWSHFYADPGNTACSGDEMRPGPMELQWFGRPGPAEMVDRHKKGPAPLFANGRLFVPGFNYVAAVDAYNGTVLWERRIPGSVRVGAFKDSSSLAAEGDRLMVAAGPECLVLDGQTGEVERRIPIPGSPSGKAWGYLAAVGGRIVGSVAKAGGSLRTMGKPEDEIIWRNRQPVVCSESVFAADRATGQRVWEYAARGGAIPNPAIAIADGRVYFVESGNPETLDSADGRIPVPDLLGRGARLVCLDLATGARRWSKEADLSSLENVLFLSAAEGILLVSGSKYAKVAPEETLGRPRPAQLRRVRYDLFAFDARTGEPRWRVTAVPNYDHILDGGHGEQVQHPAIVGGVVYGPDFAYDLKTGRPHEGWKWKKGTKCATLSTSRHCAFSRYSAAKLSYQFDLESGQEAPLVRATRPGCWINIIPAGGLVLIPEASSGCTCEYPFQASLALAPAAE